MPMWGIGSVIPGAVKAKALIRKSKNIQFKPVDSSKPRDIHAITEFNRL